MKVDTFKDLNLSSGVMAAVEELGFTKLTPVQAACIPLFRGNRKDVSVEAITGSGKTLAFLIPMLENLQKKGPFKKQDVAAIIISPTRELATQTAEVTDIFLKHVPGLSSILLIGGQSLPEDLMNIKENGMNIIIATPGRLEDMFEDKNDSYDFSIKSCVKSLEVLILDEADKLLDMGFETTLNTIFRYLPKQRQTGLFSATQTKYVEDLVRAGLKNPTCITVKEKGVEESSSKTPSTLSNFYMVCEPDKKLSILFSFLTSNQGGKYMVFFSTCAAVSYFAGVLKLLLKEFNVMSIHGKMRKQRHKIFSAFKESDNAILLCSDVMARGVDIPDVNWVIQYDPPSSASSFVHRCGRTARIGKTGNALIMVLPKEETFVDFLEINQKVILERMEAPDVDDISPRIRKIASKNRTIFDKSIKAFVSHIRFYTKHECELLFRVKDLDFGKLANGFALLKLPKVSEMKNRDVSGFVTSDVCIDDIPYLDKKSEEQRLAELEEFKKSGKVKKKKVSEKKARLMQIQIEKKKKEGRRAKLKRRKKKREDEAKAEKRKADLKEDEWFEFQRDARLLNKLKRRMITEKQFLSEIAPALLK